ncbi:MAG TPA: hypothetical protein VN026_00850 [Bacteroidia bacterium]|jgi:hypothetical protein|nr:hypothetical protein [Bacteroidia bacterium]
MKKEIMYYLWKDKQDIFYITDYKEIDKDGKVNIDACGGYVEAELMHSSKVKKDCIAHAEKLTFGK